MAKARLFVFSGNFNTTEDAQTYAQPIWEDEPDGSATKEEYEAWEDRNPSHAFTSNFNVSIDSAFVEVIDGDDRLSYLTTLLLHQSDIIRVTNLAHQHNTFVTYLSYSEQVEIANSTKELTFCGAFDFFNSVR